MPNHAPITLRRAVPSDEPALHQLSRGERINPNALDWQHFVVAYDSKGLAGAVQLRPHPGGVRELGSLMVRRDLRGRQLAARLIDTLLNGYRGRVLMVTRAAFAPHYARWDFKRISPWRAPPSIRKHYLLGQVLGGLVSLAHGRIPARLAVLDGGVR